MLTNARWATLLVVSMTGCGGNVVFVEDGSGGASSSTDSGSSSVSQASTGLTASVATGASCDVLLADLDDAVRAAQSCDPTLDVIQCDGSAILDDECQCPSIVANEKNPDAYQAALAAFDAWVAAGCGPFDCGACFPAQGGFCQPGPDGLHGTCVAIAPD